MEGMFLIPFAVIHGPQGGAHVEVEGSTFVGSWFDQMLIRSMLTLHQEGEAPDVSGFAQAFI